MEAVIFEPTESRAPDSNDARSLSKNTGYRSIRWLVGVIFLGARRHSPSLSELENRQNRRRTVIEDFHRLPWVSRFKNHKFSIE
jgi:hypothetical protein